MQRSEQLGWFSISPGSRSIRHSDKFKSQIAAYERREQAAAATKIQAYARGACSRRKPAPPPAVAEPKMEPMPGAYGLDDAMSGAYGLDVVGDCSSVLGTNNAPFSKYPGATGLWRVHNTGTEPWPPGGIILHPDGGPGLQVPPSLPEPVLSGEEAVVGVAWSDSADSATSALVSALRDEPAKLKAARQSPVSAPAASPVSPASPASPPPLRPPPPLPESPVALPSPPPPPAPSPPAPSSAAHEAVPPLEKKTYHDYTDEMDGLLKPYEALSPPAQPPPAPSCARRALAHRPHPTMPTPLPHRPRDTPRAPPPSRSPHLQPLPRVHRRRTRAHRVHRSRRTAT